MTDPTDDSGNGPQRLGLLASALAGRTVTVAPGIPGEPAWTDGSRIFVADDASAGEQLQAVTVQASLLAGGGLDPGLIRKLRRHSTLAKRYLAVEGQRALAANDALLPGNACSLIDPELANRAMCAADSLRLAQGRDPIADPPDSFGVIKVRQLLAVGAAGQSSNADSTHTPRRETRKALADWDDGEEDDPVGADVADPFSSPVGGGGFIGKLLQRMMSRVRQLSEGGPPGADAPTHRSNRAIRGAGAVLSTATALSSGAASEDGHSNGRKYPEWDHQHRHYRPDWCTVEESDPSCEGVRPLARPDVHALRRPLTRLGIGLDRCRRQAQGDDIDIDAAVEARVETLAGSAPDEAVYLDNLHRRRDLAVLLLLDISGSVAEAGTVGQTVHEQQRAAAAALTVALHELGDRVALYAFNSQGRSAVNMLPVKRFDDGLGTLTMQRLASLTPGAYSRLGAAIRHGTSIIGERAGTARRLLVVLSDGLAYDHGYERVYGAADARRALTEARREGIGCLCLTIGAATGSGELSRVFGSAAHASIPKPTLLADYIGPLFRSALRTADLRRKVA